MIVRGGLGAGVQKSFTRTDPSAGLNLEKFDKISSGTNHIYKPRLKFFNSVSVVLEFSKFTEQNISETTEYYE